MPTTPVSDTLERELAQLRAAWAEREPQLYAAERKAEELRDENRELRTMLALAHCGTSLYHDDGELQDTREHPWIDWRRDTVGEIQTKLATRASQKLHRVEAAERLGYGLSND